MKRSILFISQIIIAVTTYGQSPSFQWGRQLSHPFTDHWDEGYGIAADTSGNQFVTGYFTDGTIVLGNDTLHNSGTSGSEDIFLAKYDSDGNAVWARKAGGTLSDWGISTCTDKSGNVFITGQFKSPIAIFGNDTLHNAGGMDFFIAKYDANGNELWARSSNGTYDDSGLDLGTDAAGNVYVSGWFSYYSVHFGATTLYSTTDHTVFIVKYDTNGNAIWAKNPIGGGYSGSVIKSLGVDQSGYSYLVGQIGTVTSFMKSDPAGNPLWTKSMPGTFPDVSICTDNFGNIYLTGYFQNASATFDSITLFNSSVHPSASDMFLAKYTASGNLCWVRRTTGNSYEWGVDVCADNKGSVFVTGSFFSQTVHFDSVVLTKPDSGYANLFLAKYDSSGNIMSAARAGTGNSSYTTGWGICSDPSGNAYITGTYSSDSISFGPDLLLNPGSLGGSFHFCIAKWGKADITTGIVDNTVHSDVVIYPNPTTGVLNIVLPSSGNKNTSVEIYNSTGNLVYSKQTTNELNAVDLENQAAGIYFIKVISSNTTISTKKIIKQ